MATAVRAPWHLWAVGLFALLFSALGVADFAMARMLGARYMAAAGMTPAQIAHYQAMPVWALVVWALCAITAFIASSLLLLRRAAAAQAYLLALGAFAIELLYTYALTDGGAVMGLAMAITSAIIGTLLALFGWYAGAMTRRGVLS